MASQGPLYPTVAVNVSAAPESAEPWVTPTNVGSDNGAEATITAATFDTPDISQQLVMSGFGFTVPSTATIDGILVEIDRRNAAGAASDNRVQLRNASGTLVGTNKAATTTDWPTATAVASYGSSSDTWAASPTPAMVNDPDFGVVLSVQADAANTDIEVDFVRITVFYTPAAPPPISGSGSPVATLGKTASGTATQTFEGSGSPTASLSATADGTAEQTFTGAGAPVTGLSATASGVAEQGFEGSGDATATLSPTASGDATMTPDGGGTPPGVTGSGTAVATLHPFASSSATMTPDDGEQEEPPPPPRRRPRGFMVMSQAPVPEAPVEEEEEERIAEAEPLPELEPFPTLEPLQFNRVEIPRLQPRVTRVQETTDDDDDELWLDILSVI